MPAGRLTTRSLLACAVFGAASAPFVWAAIALNTALAAVAPWLAYPTPAPFMAGALVSAMLIRKPGAALLAGIATVIVGLGLMSLLTTAFVELAALLFRPLLRIGDAPLFGRRVLLFSLAAGALSGVGLSSGIFMISAVREALPWELLLAGSVAKIAICAGWGLVSFFIAKALYNVGVNPQGLRPAADSRTP
ncbi:hypothetical protein ACFSSC_03510 [Corynebacterium mendelii]|uniref:ABC transporter permease n=1 Tax=Corynebacterium mendelii TaxID=2765362 RepID=A0A939DZ70_9CORY|nr:hypothetical protein [Corynebacterium mendelii]MBN9643529.1 hypothetical protein [Corynebacterium mendelii]